jgi:hypothetical protein
VEAVGRVSLLGAGKLWYHHQRGRIPMDLLTFLDWFCFDAGGLACERRDGVGILLEVV